MVLAMLLLGACHKPLTWETPRYMREQDRFAKYAQEAPPAAEGQPGETAPSRHLYVTAFSGDDIVLLRDFEEIARAAAGDNPDPDRHRALGGHLWSDAIDGKETVVFRDGEEYLRWAGEELFTGFTLLDGVLYTLGQRPGNQGFCYRADGKEVFSDAGGRIAGTSVGQQWDGIYYCYGIPIQHGNSTTWEYRIMKGAETIRTLADDSVGAVLDIRVFNGLVFRVERQGENVCYVSPRGSFNYGPASKASIVKIGTDVCVRGYNPSGTACWYRYNLKVLAWENCSEMLFDGSYRAWWREEDGRIVSLFVKEKAIDIEPGRYSMATPLCAGFFGGTFCAALTDAIGEEHLIVTDTSATPLHMEGTITSLRLE